MKVLILIILITIVGCQAAEEDFYADAGKEAISKLAPQDVLDQIRIQEADKAHNESMTKMRSMLTWMGGVLVVAAVLLILNKDIPQAMICGVSAGGCFSAVAAPDYWYKYIFIALISLLALGMFLMSKRTKGGLFFGIKD